MSMTKYCITYHIDNDNRIIHISDEWQPFADSNRAKQLTRDKVIGQSIYTFISDRESRHIYEMLFARCREKNNTLHFPFRCDAPDTRRFMQMTISPLADDTIAITSCILREEKRESVALLDIDCDRSDEFVTICGWCKKVRMENDQWVEVEQAIQHLKLFDTLVLPRLSHGMCQPCHEAQMALLREGD